MIFGRLVSAVFASALLAQRVLSLDVSAPHFAFGGVNYPHLASLEPEERDNVIRQLVAANVSVIRLVIAADGNHTDVEPNMGVFDGASMKRYDETLWSIYKISKGKTKVIIVPHDVHGLRGTNGAECDAYCKKVGPAWLDFYITEELRARYRQRLAYILHYYESKNFKGSNWKKLDDIILGVDLQNEPFCGVYPIPGGESWLCHMAEYMRGYMGLHENIAIISGGVSGVITEDGQQNMPESVWGCDAIDVISIHGHFRSSEEKSAGAAWARLFLPGSPLVSRALGKKKLLVEEFTYVDWEQGNKAADIWDQAEALSFRGIPWLYSSVKAGEITSRSQVKLRGNKKSPITALKDALQKANKSPSMFDWSKHIKRQSPPTPHNEISPNLWKPAQGDCTFGCLGWLCNAMDGCSSDLLCKNNICQPCDDVGCPGMSCDGYKSLCQEPYQCVHGQCQACTSRTDLAELHGTCESTNTQCTKEFFPTTPICNFCDKRTQSCRGAPCERASDCDADQQCDWGLCKPCTEGCLGMECGSSKHCKTGACNMYGRCDYPPKLQKKKDTYDLPLGRRSPCGPGQDCNYNRQPAGLKPQPVLQGKAHSRGAGESAAKSVAPPTATATAAATAT